MIGSMPAKKDFAQQALAAVEQIAGDGPLIDTPEKAHARKQAEAAKPPRGQRGGLRGGNARAKALTAKQRAEIAQAAAAARWKKA